MTFNEADTLVQYGSIAYSQTNKEIEEDFLNYARKFRNSSLHFGSDSSATASNTERDHFINCNNTNDTQIRKSMMNTDQWLENLTAFHFGEISPVNGVDMLLEAAYTIEQQKPEKDSPNLTASDAVLHKEANSSTLNLDSAEYGKYEIIEELIQMKGENVLFDMLSNHTK
ncbi:hypothetical protein BDF20DRAFT_352394 [Mycotypha africana]|uniref:uncharacterized protein n=1 Tax=Mycotypha africana TaxID=64632 RepID=UPI00230039A4|nr:uncharacterized protein BDF20DRAFT_352394 [Mycotypha africana]KAI8966973.1 hypothetical protein BDF20DRAFT_352394 [Mycotypha africana]